MTTPLQQHQPHEAAADLGDAATSTSRTPPPGWYSMLRAFTVPRWHAGKPLLNRPPVPNAEWISLSGRRGFEPGLFFRPAHMAVDGDGFSMSTTAS